MPHISSLLLSLYINEHHDERDIGQYNVLDYMDGDVSLMAIDLMGETFLSASDDSGTTCDVDDGT